MSNSELIFIYVEIFTFAPITGAYYWFTMNLTIKKPLILESTTDLVGDQCLDVLFGLKFGQGDNLGADLE